MFRVCVCVGGGVTYISVDACLFSRRLTPPTLSLDEVAFEHIGLSDSGEREGGRERERARERERERERERPNRDAVLECMYAMYKHISYRLTQERLQLLCTLFP